MAMCSIILATLKTGFGIHQWNVSLPHVSIFLKVSSLHACSNAALNHLKLILSVHVRVHDSGPGRSVLYRAVDSITLQENFCGDSQKHHIRVDPSSTLAESRLPPCLGF